MCGLIGDTITYNAPQSSDIADCYAKGEVTASILNVGGLSGTNWGNLSNCFADCTVLGNNSVGGLVGLNYGAITQCFAAGAVAAANCRRMAGVNNRCGGLSEFLFSGKMSWQHRWPAWWEPIMTPSHTVTRRRCGRNNNSRRTGRRTCGGAAFNACFWDIQSADVRRFGSPIDRAAYRDRHKHKLMQTLRVHGGRMGFCRGMGDLRGN
jgi:hypothetical protein